MAEIWVRYFHFLGIIVLGATLVAEHLLLKPELTPKEIQRLARIDAIYGLSALLVLAMGFTLWFGVGKPAAFYNHNPIFHTKVTLFLIIALISIYPTVFFIKNRKTDQNVVVPKKIIMLLRIELLILAILPLLATMMAKGIGIKA